MKQIADLAASGYVVMPTAFGQDEERPESRVWSVFSTLHGDRVNTLQALGPEGVLRVLDADNQADRSKGGTLKLRDIALAFWRAKAGVPVADIKVFSYRIVVEDTCVFVTDHVYKRMGKQPADNLRLRRAAADRTESECFMLMEKLVPFAIGVARACEEYAELACRRIGEFVITDLSSEEGGTKDDATFKHLDIILEDKEVKATGE